MEQQTSPLIKVSEASEKILRCKPARVYENIRRRVYPPGVVVFLSEKTIRFHRDNLLRWIESGGTLSNNGNGSEKLVA